SPPFCPQCGKVLPKPLWPPSRGASVVRANGGPGPSERSVVDAIDPTPAATYQAEVTTRLQRPAGRLLPAHRRAGQPEAEHPASLPEPWRLTMDTLVVDAAHLDRAVALAVDSVANAG